MGSDTVDGKMEAKSPPRFEEVAEKPDNQKTIPLIEAQALGIIPTDLLADSPQSDINEEEAGDEHKL
jgi:hypothetical protein